MRGEGVRGLPPTLNTGPSVQETDRQTDGQDPGRGPYVHRNAQTRVRRSVPTNPATRDGARRRPPGRTTVVTGTPGSVTPPNSRSPTRVDTLRRPRPPRTFRVEPSVRRLPPVQHRPRLLQPPHLDVDLAPLGDRVPESRDLLCSVGDVRADGPARDGGVTAEETNRPVGTSVTQAAGDEVDVVRGHSDRALTRSQAPGPPRRTS